MVSSVRPNCWLVACRPRFGARRQTISLRNASRPRISSSSDAHEVRGAPVEVDPDRRRRSEQLRERPEPWREHVEVRARLELVVVGNVTAHAPVGGTVEPRLERPRSVRRVRRVHVDEIDLPASPSAASASATSSASPRTIRTVGPRRPASLRPDERPGGRLTWGGSGDEAPPSPRRHDVSRCRILRCERPFPRYPLPRGPFRRDEPAALTCIFSLA